MYLPYFQTMEHKFNIGDTIKDLITGEVYEVIGLPNKHKKFYKTIRHGHPEVYYYFLEDEIALAEEETVRKRIYRNKQMEGVFRTWGANDVSFYLDDKYINKMQAFLALMDISPNEAADKKFRLSIVMEEISDDF